MEGNIWIAAGEKGLLPAIRALDLPDAHLLAVGQDQLFCFSRQKGEVLYVQKERWLSSAPGLEAMCISQNGRFLYQLSGEADTLLCVDVKTAQPLFSVKCGCYPQDLSLHPAYSLIAAATGAAGEIKVFKTPDLTPHSTYRVPGIAARVAFAKTGLVFLSAVEKGDVHTMLGLIRHGSSSFEELALYKGLPGSLCILPDGTVVLSVWGQLIRVRLRPYKVLFSKPVEGLITHIAQDSGELLLTDSALGQVSLMPLNQSRQMLPLYQGDWVYGVFGE